MRCFFCFIFLFFVCTISVCHANTHVHGYIPEKKIKVGQKMQDVVEFVGEPSFVDGKNWYYAKITLEQNRLGISKKYSSLVKKVVFDAQVQVVSVKDFKTLRQKLPKFTSHSETKKTKSSIKNKISQIFGNIAPAI